MQNIYNMQKSKRNTIRKGRKSRKIRRFTKRRIVKGGGDNYQNIQKDNEFVNTIINPYKQAQRERAMQREIMLRRAEAEVEAEERQRVEEIRQSDLRRQIIAEERQREEERLREEQRQGNQRSALDALFALP